MSRMNVDLNIDRRVAWVTIEGQVSMDHYENYVNTCRRGFKADWIQVIDVRIGFTKSTYKELEKLAVLSVEVHRNCPIRATIMINPEDFMFGQSRQYQTLKEIESREQKISPVPEMRLCRTKEGADQIIEEIRRCDEIEKVKAEKRRGNSKRGDL